MQLACYFRYFWGVNPTFKWFLADQQLDQRSASGLSYANGTATFGSFLLYSVTRKDDQQNLTCSVSVEGKKVNQTGYHNTSSVILTIHCMWSDGNVLFWKINNWYNHYFREFELLVKLIFPGTKWLLLRRRHFQLNFLE